MDWNIKPSSQWDWDSLSVLDGKGSENPKHIMSQPVEWIVDNGSLYSSGGGGCSGSDLVNVCSSKSSISASTDTMPPGTRNSEIGFQPTKVSTNDFSNKKEISRAEDSAASSEAVPFTGSGEPPIGLKLGRRTYFEDISPGSDIKASYLPAMPARTTTTPKKSRVSHQITQIVCCQVEGCGIDLSSAKGYHRKHKVCESHSKCPKVIVAGRERRFCQQCSRFHDLSEFDQKKRSCRRRLSDHNARRRKPPPEMISFGSNRFSSSFYDDGHQINFLMNKTPFGYLRTDTSSMWGNSSEFRLPQSRESFISTTKEGGTGGQLRLPINEFSSSASTFRYDVGRLLPSKGTTVEILNQGLGASTTASNLDESPDIRRALSLLSNDTWGLANHEPSPSLNQIVHLNHTNNAGFCATHATHSSSDNWLAELPLGHESRELPCTFYNSAGQFQEIQLLKAPYGSGSFDSN